MIVDHCCQQVVGRADRVEVACKVKVDVLHGDDLGVSAARCAALDAEDRSKRGLAKGYHDFFAQFLKAVGQSDGSCGLALARGRGVHCCHKDQLAVFSVRILEKLIVDLCLVLSVLLQIVVADARLFGDLRDRKHLTFLRDFDITLVSHC